MTDSRLRELGRAWELSKSLEDEAAYLRERLRAGEVSPERLDAAARLGSEAAQLVTDAAAARDAWETEDVVAAFCALTPQERIAVACSAAERCAGLWGERLPQGPLPERALQAVRSWLAGSVRAEDVAAHGDAVWSCQTADVSDGATQSARSVYEVVEGVGKQGRYQAYSCSTALNRAVRALGVNAWQEAVRAQGEGAAKLAERWRKAKEIAWQRSLLIGALLTEA